MKKSTLILTLPWMIFFLSCNRQPSYNERTINSLHKDTVASSDMSDTGKNKIITDTFPSDIKKIKLVISYNPSRPNDYIAAHESGVPVTGKYAKDREVDKGQIHFPCKNKRLQDYKISKERIINIISIKYDMDVYDKTDYVFTQDTIFEVHTSTANAGIFTDSDIKFIPNNIDFSGKTKYPHQKKESCNFNDYLFNFVLRFCKKNNITLKIT